MGPVDGGHKGIMLYSYAKVHRNYSNDLKILRTYGMDLVNGAPETYPTFII
jgi:hypothetical protein